jgi:putative hemolysin
MAKDHQFRTMAPLRRGGYIARMAASDADVLRAQGLRHLCFVESAGRAPLPEGLERDRFDADCDHLLVEDSDGRLVCAARVQVFNAGGAISAGYSAQYYDLTRLEAFRAPLVELGRFCVHPEYGDADVLRLAWAMLATLVDSCGAGMLFGCSSFAGIVAAPYRAAFDLLAARHLAPEIYAPAVRAGEVVHYAKAAGALGDRRAALAQVPPLLRTYLSMGGWVSDHAVVDRDLNTLHVFTGLEIAAIPQARAQALRAVAG